MSSRKRQSNLAGLLLPHNNLTPCNNIVSMELACHQVSWAVHCLGNTHVLGCCWAHFVAWLTWRWAWKWQHMRWIFYFVLIVLWLFFCCILNIWSLNLVRVVTTSHAATSFFFIFFSGCTFPEHKTHHFLFNQGIFTVKQRCSTICLDQQVFMKRVDFVSY